MTDTGRPAVTFTVCSPLALGLALQLVSRGRPEAVAGCWLLSSVDVLIAPTKTITRLSSFPLRIIRDT